MGHVTKRSPKIPPTTGRTRLYLCEVVSIKEKNVGLNIESTYNYVVFMV